MGYDKLIGKAVMVTGGASDLGIAIGLTFGRLGARVVLGDIRLENVEKAAGKLREEGIEVLGVSMDVTDQDSVKKAFEWGIQKFGGLDILINSAGITRMQNIEDIGMKDWDFVFGVNVRGTFSCCQEFSNHRRDCHQGGAIVNIASNAAKVTFPGQAHYNASKAAIVNLTQSLAKELAPYQINVNAVCPGAIDTDMLKYCMECSIADAPEGEKPTIGELRNAWGPAQIGRLIRPEEVANVVAFLATEEALIIRGQAISIDAGNTPF